MAAKKWWPIIVGVVIFVVIVGLGLIGTVAYLVSRQVSVQTVPAQQGTEEFERIRASLAGQKPFIEMPAEDSDAAPIVHRELETHEPGRLSTIHVRVWVASDRKLVRVDLPMWTLRLMGNNPITISGNDEGFRGIKLKVTPEEIERRGPGLILDHAGPRGERIVIWSE